jgi:hypothetical protein
MLALCVICKNRIEGVQHNKCMRGNNDDKLLFL